MAIYVITKKPDALLQHIKRSIQLRQIDTWLLDDDGDFTHIPSQWYNKAWMRAYIGRDKNGHNDLIIGIIGRRQENMSKVIYAVYHGRFAEMLLTHFDTEIEQIDISSLPDAKYDNIYTSDL